MRQLLRRDPCLVPTREITLTTVDSWGYLEDPSRAIGILSVDSTYPVLLAGDTRHAYSASIVYSDSMKAELKAELKAEFTVQLEAFAE